MGVYFLKRSTHAVAEIQHVSKRDAEANGRVECVALDVLVYGVFIDFVFVRVSGSKLGVHLTCQRSCAHRADIIVNKLVHFGCVLVCVELAQPAHTGCLNVCEFIYFSYKTRDRAVVHR